MEIGRRRIACKRARRKELGSNRGRKNMNTRNEDIGKKKC
jgi:hypothetical protein